MRIDSHGNNGHSHSHTGCFTFLPIPIPNFVTNSHYHGIPMGFPFRLGIPFPCSSLLYTASTNKLGSTFVQSCNSFILHLHFCSGVTCLVVAGSAAVEQRTAGTSLAVDDGQCKRLGHRWANLSRSPSDARR